MTPFRKWMKEVDLVIAGICGLSHDDLVDVDYMGMFESNMSPKEVAHETLAESGMTELIMETNDAG